MTARGGRRRASGKAEREFVGEADEILERMRGHLADLAERSSDGGEVPPELVNGLFRAAHSLKGLAGLFGFEPIFALAHRLEDLLDALRLGRSALDAEALDRIERAVGLFAELLSRVGDAAALAALEAPVAALAAELARHGPARGGAEAPAPGAAPRGHEAAAQRGEAERGACLPATRRQAAREAAAPGPVPGAPPPPARPDPLAELGLDRSLLAALTEYEEHRLRESLARDRNVLLAEATFEILSFEEGLAELTQGLAGMGEVLSTLPAPGECAESQIRFSLLVASERSAEEIAAALELPGVSIRRVGGGARGGGPSPEARGVESLQSPSETVRVDIRKLDELMNLVGELVIQREALAAFTARLAAEPATARSASELGRIQKDLERRVRELQEAVLEVRMVPLRQVFERVARVVRRLRSELGKEVRLEILGADTELDKLIAEELADPLMHIVRNALDHAIESPDERRAGGKPAEGLVRIEASQRGNHVVIAVSDDGRGIDRAALRARAESLGLVRPDEALGERETLDLVFAPGLSTRSEVSGTSGRGVGMDVVRTNVTLLGGIVAVDSVPNRGTAVTLTLPITLAILQVILVEAGGRRFAVPLAAVQETLLVDPCEIQRSEGREILDLRGAALPLRRLAAELGLAPAPPGAKLFAVVLRMGDARLGLLVDRLEGQQDAVIKPIEGPIPAVRAIAGAAELGGPQPVLVLDASGLLAEAHGRREAA